MTLPGFTTCARCGHVAGVMCPHCGKQDSLLGSSMWLGGTQYRYCHTYADKPTCYEQQNWINAFVIEAHDVVDLEAPFTHEEEEMLPLDGNE